MMHELFVTLEAELTAAHCSLGELIDVTLADVDLGQPVLNDTDERFNELLEQLKGSFGRLIEQSKADVDIV